MNIRIKDKETKNISNKISIKDIIYHQDDIEFQFVTSEGIETLPYSDFVFYKDEYELILEDEKKDEKKIKVFISQPVRNKTENELKEEREELIKQLQDDGYMIIDAPLPISTTLLADYNVATQYLSKAVTNIGKSDAVVFMTNWETDRTCQTEFEIAKSCGKFIKLL